MNSSCLVCQVDEFSRCSINNEAQSASTANLPNRQNQRGRGILNDPIIFALSTFIGNVPQLELSSPWAARPVFPLRRFIYIFPQWSRIRRGQCSVKNTSFPQIPALVWARELIQYWIPCLRGEPVWPASREMGQKTASSLFWYRCPLRASHLRALKVGLANQTWQLSFYLILWNSLLLQSGPMAAGTHSHRVVEMIFSIQPLDTISLAVHLRNRNNHTDDLFSRQTPLWSSSSSRPDALSYILTTVPYAHPAPATAGAVAELWPRQKTLHTQERYYQYSWNISNAARQCFWNDDINSRNCSESMRSSAVSF